ncbi:hypothetical protein FGK63_14245 [Ruegeria sediminis]|uniref:Uncharacterized protein n=1 Tax=Ruegeria sediminis TaxID=2583820 RepID=A0ABY2WVE1_9RHOB|nr:hypothetical protein [Ruegeria sediminis]TMV06315.1 hypothetical protein FGK63_14245 [Ruegeria sediminis]
MSEKLEALLTNLSTSEAASLMTAAHQISAAARAEFGTEVPLDDIAGLVQVRDAVFHGGLDAADMSNALYNLRQNSAAVREHLARTEGVAEAAKMGADTSSGELDGETLMSIKSPARRMALARKHGFALPKADRGDRRPAETYSATDTDTVAQTINDAVARMNAARGITK